MARLIRLCTCMDTHIVSISTSSTYGKYCHLPLPNLLEGNKYSSAKGLYLEYSSANSPHLVFIGPRVCNFGINNLLSQQIS